MRWLLLYDSSVIRAVGGIHFLIRGNISRMPVCVLCFFLFFFVRKASNHPSIWLLLVSDQRFLVLLSSVSLLLSAARSFEKHVPPSSHFTSINVILWELTGVLIGKRNWIQMICLRWNDNARSLTKQSRGCLSLGGALHHVSNFPPHLFAARETVWDLLA